MIAVDLGAHIGVFGVQALTAFPDARIVAYEADTSNADILHRCIARSGRDDRWRASAGVSDGIDCFADGLFAGSHVTQIELGTMKVPRRDVFPDLAAADLIKIDIEGSEWPILYDPRLAKLTPILVALEYHPEQCGS